MEKTTSMKEMVMNMMCHERENLQEDLHAAKLSYADINLEEGDYKCRDERKTNCKVIEGQIVMLSERTIFRIYKEAYGKSYFDSK